MKTLNIIQKSTPILAFLLLFILSIFIFIIFFILKHIATINGSFIADVPFENIKEWGAVGDMFGSVNAFFSGLTVVGVFVAIYYQRKELQAVKKEFKTQNENLKLQQFENTFFNLLENFNAFKTSLKFKDYKGIYAIEKLLQKTELGGATECRNDYHIRAFNYLNNSDYERGYNLNALTIMGPYFSQLYRIIKFIDSTEGVDEDKKKEYAKIVRAQLNWAEIKFLAYNCLSIHGRKNFKPLVEKYALLKNLDYRDYKNVLDSKKIYKEKLGESGVNLDLFLKKEKSFNAGFDFDFSNNTLDENYNLQEAIYNQCINQRVEYKTDKNKKLNEFCTYLAESLNIICDYQPKFKDQFIRGEKDISYFVEEVQSLYLNTDFYEPRAFGVDDYDSIEGSSYYSI